MKTEILPDAEAVARRGAALIAELAREAVRARGQFSWAASGGTTPLRMFEHLANEDVPWAQVHVFQVDERVVEASSPARNFTQLKTRLLDKVAVHADHVHPIEVPDLTHAHAIEAALHAAAARYAQQLRAVAGSSVRLDLVHLGLGADGHTASLFEGDAATQVSNSEVAVTGLHAGFRRFTLTYPVLAAARCLLWVATGTEKAEALRRLLAGNAAIPAGRVSAVNAIVLAEAASAQHDA